MLPKRLEDTSKQSRHLGWACLGASRITRSTNTDTEVYKKHIMPGGREKVEQSDTLFAFQIGKKV